jgi:hypothetical protein
MSTAIRDRTAFAVAFTRGTEHPRIRAVLDTCKTPEQPRPDIVSIPIADVLGPDGHQHCEGYKLAGDNSRAARRDRRTWLQENKAGDPPSVAQPLVVPVDFRDGTIDYTFTVNAEGRYEILSMYPSPPARETDR